MSNLLIWDFKYDEHNRHTSDISIKKESYILLNNMKIEAGFKPKKRICHLTNALFNKLRNLIPRIVQQIHDLIQFR